MCDCKPKRTTIDSKGVGTCQTCGAKTQHRPTNFLDYIYFDEFKLTTSNQIKQIRKDLCLR